MSEFYNASKKYEEVINYYKGLTNNGWQWSDESIFYKRINADTCDIIKTFKDNTYELIKKDLRENQYCYRKDSFGPGLEIELFADEHGNDLLLFLNYGLEIKEEMNSILKELDEIISKI